MKSIFSKEFFMLGGIYLIAAYMSDWVADIFRLIQPKLGISFDAAAGVEIFGVLLFVVFFILFLRGVWTGKYPQKISQIAENRPKMAVYLVYLGFFLYIIWPVNIGLLFVLHSDDFVAKTKEVCANILVYSNIVGIIVVLTAATFKVR